MFRAFSLTSAVILGGWLPASAQSFDVAGARALGMGGAFVAVADDASSVFWNPAGLASGQPAGGTIEWVRFRVGDRDGKWTTPPVERSASLASFGTWPLAFSILDLEESRLWGGPGSRAERIETRHYGLSLLQTLTDGIVVGATLRYVRGRASVGVVESEDADTGLDDLRSLPMRSSGAFDLDLSAMYDARVFRIGAVIRNVREPSFAAPDSRSVTIPREARVGIAILPKDGLTLAMDMDLSAVERGGLASQVVAAGAEVRVSPTAMVRAGLQWDRERGRREGLLGTVGAGVIVRRGLWLDVHGGWAGGDRGIRLGAGLRAGW